MPPRTKPATPAAAPSPSPKPMPLAQRVEICITRAANGWLLFDANARNSISVSANPLMVAETPDKLAEIVMAWARSA